MIPQDDEELVCLMWLVEWLLGGIWNLVDRDGVRVVPVEGYALD